MHPQHSIPTLTRLEAVVVKMIGLVRSRPLAQVVLITLTTTLFCSCVSFPAVTCQNVIQEKTCNILINNQQVTQLLLYVLFFHLNYDILLRKLVIWATNCSEKTKETSSSIKMTNLCSFTLLYIFANIYILFLFFFWWAFSVIFCQKTTWLIKKYILD